MKLVFAGTSEFAVSALEALFDSKHELAAVFTQPARPAGRGRRLRVPPLHAAAERLGLTPDTPEDLEAPQLRDRLAGLSPDVMIVVAYGKLIPPALLALPRHGVLNLHPSLLPRWRGAAPVERAMLAGDRETGVAVMDMVEALDAGPVYRRATTTITTRETAGELSARLAKTGAALLLDTLSALAEGSARAKTQTGEVSYAQRLTVAEARLDFTQPAAVLVRRIHAFNPRPVAWCECEGERLRLFRAEAIDEPVGAEPGTIMAADRTGLDVATGEGRLRVTELQRAGRTVQTAITFAHAGNWLGRKFN